MRYWVAMSLTRCHKFHWIYILAQMTEIVFDLPFSRYYIITCDPAVNIFPYFSPMNSTLNAFIYNFDIVGNTNEKHLSFKENAAECYACVGVCSVFFYFQCCFNSSTYCTLQCATVCPTTFVLLLLFDMSCDMPHESVANI